MLQQAIVIKNDNTMPVWWSVIAILYKAHHFVLFIISKDKNALSTGLDDHVHNDIVTYNESL